MSGNSRSFEEFAGLTPKTTVSTGAPLPATSPAAASPPAPALEVIQHAYEAAGHEHPDADSFLELRPAGPHADILEWAYIVRLRYGRDGRSITIYGTGFAAVITGRNLVQLVPRLKARKVDWLQAYDPKRWPDRPADGAAVIERIELIEEGGDSLPVDPRAAS